MYSSTHGFGGCGCSGIKSVGTLSPALGNPSPDGLGAVTPALFGTATGSTFSDAIVAGLIGYFASPNKHDRPFWSIVGAGAGLLAGTAGILGLVGTAMWARKSKSE